MKRLISFMFVILLCMALCSCGTDSPEETEVTTEAEVSTETEASTVPDETEPELYWLGDTVSTECIELTFTKYGTTDRYLQVQAEEGYVFVFVEYKIKNVGKEEFDAGPVAPKGTWWSNTDMTDIVCLDYNDGYIFEIPDSVGTAGSTFFTSPDFADMSDLKPLGSAETCECAFHVPEEVVTNTDAPLIVRFFLRSSLDNKEVEVVNYKIVR